VFVCGRDLSVFVCGSEWLLVCLRRLDPFIDRRMRVEEPQGGCGWVFLGQILDAQMAHR
jgi:hypothetical protein